ncbi:hypothetical protein [Paraburkholderia sp. JHI869]|uniref:hypothetical protein n=1 Tax=Paraburkholderia sp. JHI869 TaxID=3112959 RepID=UPI00318229F8
MVYPGVVVEYNRNTEAQKKLSAVEELLSCKVKLNVPIESSDSPRERMEHRERRRAGLHLIKPNAHYSIIVQSVEFNVGHKLIDNGDAPSRRAIPAPLETDAIEAINCMRESVD